MWRHFSFSGARLLIGKVSFLRFAIDSTSPIWRVFNAVSNAQENGRHTASHSATRHAWVRVQRTSTVTHSNCCKGPLCSTDKWEDLRFHSWNNSGWRWSGTGGGKSNAKSLSFLVSATALRRPSNAEYIRVFDYFTFSLRLKRASKYMHDVYLNKATSRELSDF